MKVTLQPTSRIVVVDGVPCRIWEGATDDGTPVHAYIRAIAVPTTASAAAQARFAERFVELRAPSMAVADLPIAMRFADDDSALVRRILTEG